MLTTTPVESHLLDVLDARLRPFVAQLPKPLQVSADPENEDKKQLSRAFAAFGLQCLAGCDPSAAAKSVVDDSGDRGIDAIYYDTESESLVLLQAKKRLDAMVNEDDAQAFVAGIRALVRHDFASFNINVRNRQAEIEDALANCNSIKIVLAFVGPGVNDAAEQTLKDLFSDPPDRDERIQGPYGVIGPNQVIQALQSTHQRRSVAETIQLAKCAKLDSHRQAFMGMVRISDLIRIHNKWDVDLYAKNLRHYLGKGKKGSVNHAIHETLASRPSDFFFLNNGVTALCDLIEPKDSPGGWKRLKVRGMSVINGAQTVASCADFSKQNPIADLSQARVLLTLIQTEAGSDFGESVTRARNHQNPVSDESFSGLDEEQNRLRIDLGLLGKVYAYRDGQAEVSPTPGSLITIAEAAFALALDSDDPRFAVIAKRDSAVLRTIGSPEYGNLFSAKTSALRLVNTVAIWRIVDKFANVNEINSSGRERLFFRHGRYALGWAAMKYFRKLVVSNQVLDPVTTEAAISAELDNVRVAMWDAFNIPVLLDGPLKFSKTESRVRPLLQDALIKALGVDAHPAVIALKARYQKTVGLGTDKAVLDAIPQNLHGQNSDTALMNFLIGRAATR